jgi:DNA-binding transcriptional LysR family regulator
MPGASRDHVQLVLTDRSRRTVGQELGVMATQTWRLADLASKHLLLREGIGWGLMPVPLVKDDLRSGALVALDLPDCRGGPYRFFATFRTDTPPGPAAAFLIARFAGQVRHPVHMSLDQAAAS